MKGECIVLKLQGSVKIAATVILLKDDDINWNRSDTICQIKDLQKVNFTFENIVV